MLLQDTRLQPCMQRRQSEDGVGRANTLIAMTLHYMLGFNEPVRSGSNVVKVRVKGKNIEQDSIPMYLAAGEPEQSTTGHVRMVHIRGMMPHLPDTYPIQFCQDAPIALQTGKVLHGDWNELSVELRKAFNLIHKCLYGQVSLKPQGN